ncbi:MAG: hypothetical protein ACK49H_03405, partial [Burkholderiales bacterium]
HHLLAPRSKSQHPPLDGRPDTPAASWRGRGGARGRGTWLWAGLPAARLDWKCAMQPEIRLGAASSSI